MAFNAFINILKESFSHLNTKNPLRLAAATAFFTTFALPPTLIIIIQTFGMFYSEKALKHGVFSQLVSVLGKESSLKLFNIFDRFQSLAHNWMIAAGGFLFLIFIATTLFHVVRFSINDVWCIKVGKNAGIGFYLKLRLKSVIVILIAGLIITVQLLASTLQLFLSKYINEIWSDYHSLLYRIVSQVVFIIVASGWFMVLFKYLPNAHPDWKTAFTGGLLTGVLFTIGKSILGFLLTFGNLKTIFGATGSFVLVLLFVFYSSFIFYYGASFTKTWAEKSNRRLRLEKHVYVYKLQEVKS